jgi:uncharacterized protein
MSRAEMNHIIVDCLMRYHPQMIGIFGSYSRNEESAGSDLDILVRFQNSPSLLQLISIENELSEKIGVKVDLVTEGAIRNERIRENISNDIKIIFSS